MARVNTRPSYVSSSRPASETPAPGGSDQENRDPDVTTRAKGKGRADMGPSSRPDSRHSLPTPTSDNSDTSRGQKRKRTQPSATQPTEAEAGEERFVRWFNPNQDTDERRQLKRESRAAEREFNESREDLLKGSGDGLYKTIVQANLLFQKVKQTGDATLDSGLLVKVSDLAYKKTAQLVNGDSSTGIDVDEFLSKCITFMRNGGAEHGDADAGPATQRRRRTRPQNNRDDDGEDDDVAGEPLDWEALGLLACFPNNSRPACPSFLLGPLSVQKKQRTQTQRRARQAKDTVGKETRPEALTKEDMNQTEENGLTAICARIRTQLAHHVSRGQKALLDAGIKDDAGLATPEARRLMRKIKTGSTGGISLFDFVLNAKSFGQTVENIFYVSFLIKEGAVGLEHDQDGLPTLSIANRATIEEKNERNKKNKEEKKSEHQKHQAVFALDFDTWRSLCKSFDVQDSMIPHRDEPEQAQLGSKGWYA